MIICYSTINNGACPLGASKTPRAALAIPACGVGDFRVRRFQPQCIVKSLCEATTL